MAVSPTQTDSLDTKVKTKVAIAKGSLQYRKINCSFVSADFLASQVSNCQYEDGNHLLAKVWIPFLQYK